MTFKIHNMGFFDFKSDAKFDSVIMDVITDIGKNGYKKSISVSKLVMDFFPASV